MSGRSDMEGSESENSTYEEDLEVQLYGLVHYATDSLDAVAAEDISTENNKSHNQQDSAKRAQVSSTLSVQNSSESVNVNSDCQSTPTEQNEPLCTEKHKDLKKKCKKPEKVIDYLTLLKEYKTARAQQNFAEMSRNPSLLWCHKQQNMAKGYRKRYWMKEASEQSVNAAFNHNSDPPLQVFNDSSCYYNRNEISHRKEFSAAPENAEAFVTQHFNGYTTFQDPCMTECDRSSAAKKSKNYLDTMMNHINHNENNYEIPHKKMKRRHKRRKSVQNANIDMSSRAEITDNNKSAKAPKHENKGKQQKEVQENDVADHTFDKNINKNDIDSRYSIIPSKREKEVQENDVADHTFDKNINKNGIDSRYSITLSKKEEDDVIVLDSSDSESSIVVLGSPPTPEPPPVVCLDSDSEILRHQQETAASQQQLLLNVAAPKQPSREEIQQNIEIIEDHPTTSPSSPKNAVASSSTSQVTTKAKRHRSVRDCQKWTSEMKSYYNESWGGEHFDVISLQRQMSNNPMKWRVSQRDFHVGIYRKRQDKCTNCNQFGHPKWHCPEPLRPLCCKMCGAQGHTEPRCPRPICLQCGERTMVYVRCCRNCRNGSYCTVCNKNGHSHDACPEVWRKLCTTTSLRQVRKPHRPKYKPMEQQWCCVCAKKGHFPEDCQPFYVEPITFQVNNEMHTPKVKKKKRKKYYIELHRRKVHYGMPCCTKIATISLCICDFFILKNIYG